MRAVLAGLLALVAGCAELGVITDGTSVSVGKPSRGYLVDGSRLPDAGEGYTTREVWLARNNRYGTDELIDLVAGVARRLAGKVKDVKLVVADLSANSGGAGGAAAFHRSHQSGRDVDLLYYMRDAQGQPFEPDAMHVFDWRGRARDKSGLTIDVPRTWQLVHELLDAPEAFVQYIFIYQPIAELLIEHAQKIGDDPVIIARAKRALRQPGDSARHDDHMHVRIYCAKADREYGCEDIGPLDLLAEREAEQAQVMDAIVAGLAAKGENKSTPEPSVRASTLSLTASGAASTSIHSLLRTRTDRIDLRGWR